MLCCCKIVHFIFIIFLFLEWGLNLNKTFSYSTALVNNELQFVFSLSASKTPLSATLSNFVSLFLSHVYFESEQNCTCVLFQTLSTHTLPTVMQGVNHRRPDTCPTTTFLAWNSLCVSRTRDWKDNALSLSLLAHSNDILLSWNTTIFLSWELFFLSYFFPFFLLYFYLIETAVRLMES